MRRLAHAMLFLVCVLILFGFVVSTAYAVGHVFADVVSHLGDNGG